LYRVNKVLQFTRAKVDLNQILWAVHSLFVSAVILLTCWTVLGDPGWTREVDQETGESFGQCYQDTSAWFFATGFLMLIPTVLSFIMSWKTKDVDDSFSEAWWIFALIFVQLQVSTENPRQRLIEDSNSWN
jgi:hypothetical protein